MDDAAAKRVNRTETKVMRSRVNSIVGKATTVEDQACEPGDRELSERRMA